MPWSVYILKCADNSYYVGHTADLEKRLETHQNGKGAAHTAKRLPVVLMYHEAAGSKTAAMKRESQLKGWSRAKKAALINGEFQTLKTLSRCRSVHGTPD